MLRFLHHISAVLFVLLGAALFVLEVLWRHGTWMPWSQAILTSLPLPLIAIGLLYGGLSITLSAQEGRTSRTLVGSIIGIACLLLFVVFAILRLWPLS